MPIYSRAPDGNYRNVETGEIVDPPVPMPQPEITTSEQAHEVLESALYEACYGVHQKMAPIQEQGPDAVAEFVRKNYMYGVDAVGMSDEDIDRVDKALAFLGYGPVDRSTGFVRR
jgi:hypothetical protein